jgi:hypothetical protein
MRKPNQTLRITACAALVLLASAFAAAQNWTQDGPAPRYLTSAVYDSVTDQMIVFGGWQGTGLPVFNDVWSEQNVVADGQITSIVNTNWAEVLPTGTAPSARFGHTAFYDSGSNRMIVYAGATSATTCLNDVWALSTANSVGGTPAWSQLAPTGTKPGKRMGHLAFYDSTNNIMITYGGTSCAGGYFSDTWNLSHANGEGGTPAWTKLAVSGISPPARENASGIYDPVSNVLTIYSGDKGAGGFSDVWSLSHANGKGGTSKWTQLSPTGTPPPARTGATAVYDSVNNIMIVYGGINQVNGATYYTDTWLLSNANNSGATAWTKLNTSVSTSPTRRYQTAFYNSTMNNMVIFGGESEINPFPPADQIFILTDANGL